MLRMGSGKISGLWTTGIRRMVAAAAVLLVVMLLTPLGVAAHAELDTSTPASGAVLASEPATVTMRFTEPLDQSYSKAALYDATGKQIDGTRLSFGADKVTMTLALPPNLPNGTYSALWRTLSSADGHTAENYFAFTIGTNANISAVTIPGTAEGGGPAQWLQTTSRWAALLGLAAALAIWPLWLFILRPALGPVWRMAPAATRRMQRYALIALAAAALGSIYALLVQAAVLDEGSYFDKVANTVGQTRYGKLWLIRMGLLFLYAIVLAACAWWWPRHRKGEATIACLIAIALPIPFSLISHASASSAGKATTVTADMLHLLGASLWAGGLFILVFVLFPLTRKLTPDQSRCVLARAIPRFSIMALAAWGVMGLTGLYAAWLQVGNLTALTETSYGTALTVKVVLLGIALLIAAVNLLVISRRLEAPKVGEAPARIWSKRLTLTVAAELVLVIGAFVAVGQMTSKEPAREVMVQRAKQLSLPFDLSDRRADLLIAPGIAGVNHLRLEVSGQTLPTNVEALLRLTVPARQEMGTKQIQLARVAGNAFEYHSNDLGIAGDWKVTLILRYPDDTSETAQQTLHLGLTRTNVDVPGEAWRFKTTGGVSGLILVLIGVIGVVLGAFSNRARLRKEGFGLGFAALALGALLLVQARIDPALAVASGNAIDPTNQALVTRGKEVYTTYCLSCHGAELRGDGPAGTGMQPPPADFFAPHAQVHSDSDLVYWVKNGKQGTGMPAFGDKLSNDDVRAVLTYIKSVQQQEADQLSVSPDADPAKCTVASRTVDEINQLTASKTPPPMVALQPTPAADQTIDAGTKDAIAGTVSEFIACSNGMDTMRRLALFSDAAIQRSFPGGVTPSFARTVTAPPTPLPQDQWVTLKGITGFRRLSDGRIRVEIDVGYPGMASHNHGAAGAGGSGTTAILVKQGDRWLIDQLMM